MQEPVHTAQLLARVIGLSFVIFCIDLQLLWNKAQHLWYSR